MSCVCAREHTERARCADGVVLHVNSATCQTQWCLCCETRESACAALSPLMRFSGARARSHGVWCSNVMCKRDENCPISPLQSHSYYPIFLIYTTTTNIQKIAIKLWSKNRSNRRVQFTTSGNSWCKQLFATPMNHLFMFSTCCVVCHVQCHAVLLYR